MVHFVDLSKANKKVDEGNIPRSLFGPIYSLNDLKSNNNKNN